MIKFQAILVYVLMVGCVLVSSTEIPKPGYTRTMLKVGRSLPGETEELKVRTREGNVATLIVKRREKSEKRMDREVSQASEEIRDRSMVKNGNASISATTSTEADLEKRRDEVKRLVSAQVEQIRAATLSRASNDEVSKVSKILENRSIDSETLNKSEIHNKNSVGGTKIDYGSWTPLNRARTIFETNEATSNKNYEWKPLPTESNIAIDDRKDFSRYQSPEIRREGLIVLRNSPERETKNFETDGTIRARIIDNQPMHYIFLPQQSRPLTRTNIGANLSKNRGGKNVPAEVTVRSEINVKSLPKRTPMSLDADGTPIIHGTRVPDEPIDQIHTWRNARVINNKLSTQGASTLEPSTSFLSNENIAERQRFERFIKDVNRRNFEDDNNFNSEWDPKNHANTALNAEVYDSRNENYRSNHQKRMLRPEGSQIYPNSRMYTSVSQKIAPLALKTGARTPVLQYAHPELGVQPARILKSEKRRPENFPDNQNSFTEQRHKKKYVLNDKNVVDSYTLKNYYPNQHFYGLKQPNDQSFWVKVSENLRNQFSTGVERVSQLTRPVFDPLVEATHKISQNLGLTKGKEAQDKIGTIATGSSILIPALGLVASGAALGIGAVAVGRYLDADVLKRSQKEEEIEDEGPEDQRALEAIYNESMQFHTIEATNREEARRQSRSFDQLNRKNMYGEVDGASNAGNDEVRSKVNQEGVFMILEEVNDSQRIENRSTKPLVVETKRRKRNVENLDIFKAKEMEDLVGRKDFRRTGPDSLPEIVEIDVPVQGTIDITEIHLPSRNVMRNHDDEFYIDRDNEKSNSLADNIVDPDEPPTDDDLLQVETVARETSRLPEDFKTRKRRNVDNDWNFDDAFQNLEKVETVEVDDVDGDWTNSNCAKRIFCDIMIQRGQDASILMEKKMDVLLRQIQRREESQVSGQFQEVMEAVRKHDCSSFLCPEAKHTGNVSF